MPYKPTGKKTGRPKGVPDKRTMALQDKLKCWGCDPFKVLAEIASGELPCNVCRGKGKTKYQPNRVTRLIDGVKSYVLGAEGEAKLEDRTCLSCYGSGKENIGPNERSKAASELAQYIAPKRKAIEVTGEDGGAVKASITVRYVDPEPRSE